MSDKLIYFISGIIFGIGLNILFKYGKEYVMQIPSAYKLLLFGFMWGLFIMYFISQIKWSEKFKKVSDENKRLKHWKVNDDE